MSTPRAQFGARTRLKDLLWIERFLWALVSTELTIIQQGLMTKRVYQQGISDQPQQGHISIRWSTNQTLTTLFRTEPRVSSRQKSQLQGNMNALLLPLMPETSLSPFNSLGLQFKDLGMRNLTVLNQRKMLFTIWSLILARTNPSTGVIMVSIAWPRDKTSSYKSPTMKRYQALATIRRKWQSRRN